FSLWLLAWLLQLQVGDIELRAADAGATNLSALGAGQFQLFHHKLLATRVALLTAQAPFNFEPQVLQRSFFRQGFKRKSEGIAVHIGEFTDPHTNSGEVRLRAAAHFGFNRFDDGRSDTNFVQRTSLTNARQLITGQHVHDARGAEWRTHYHHA